MVDTFISYSRDNKDFAGRLAAELRQSKKDVWIDTVGIRFTSDWWEEIKRGIESSDNFLLVMSPSSLSSPVCHLEIEYARNLQKRIILINHLAVQRSSSLEGMQKRLSDEHSAYVHSLIGDRNPVLIFEANWHILDKYQQVKFAYDSSKSEKFRLGEAESPEESAAREAEDAAFMKQYQNLAEALNTDIAHVHLHTRLGLRLREWEGSKKNNSFLLFGDELKEAESWLSAYEQDKTARAQKGESPKPPEPTKEQIAYIQLSRKEENRRRLLSFSLIGLTLLAIGTGIIVAYISNGQINAAQNAENTSSANLSTATSNYATAIEGQEQAFELAATATRDFATANAAQATAAAREANALNQVSTATQALGTAMANLDDAATSEAEAFNQVATATRDVATAAAREGTAIAEVDNANMTLTPISATVTQAAVLNEINLIFSDALLNGVDFGDIDRLTTLSERYPDESSIYLMRGLLYIDLEDYDAAIDDYTRVIELDPENPAVYNNRGNAYGRLGNYQAAIDDFNRAIELAPYADEAMYSNRGLAYYNLGEKHYQKAIANFTTAIEISPYSAIPHSNRGLVYLAQENYDNAIDDFSRAIELNPNFADAYLGRGNAYFGQENYDDAVDDYERVIEIDPNIPEVYYNRAMVSRENEDYQGVISDLSRYIELESNNPIAFYNRGSAYQHEEQFLLALADFSRAIELNPNYTDAFMKRGIIYIRLEQYVAGLEDFTTAIELDPTYAGAYFNRGLTYYLLEDYEAALDDWNRAEELGYDFPPEAEQLREEMEEDLEENPSGPDG